jgi:hypothetical protein
MAWAELPVAKDVATAAITKAEAVRADLKVMVSRSEECVVGCCVPPDEHTISGINGRGDELRQAEL